jgi:lipoprotein-anchoring transpeptidase ErfK/SrfK
MMSSRRKKRGGGPFVVFIIVVAAGVGTWWLWPEMGEVDATPQHEATPELATRAAEPPPIPLVEFDPKPLRADSPAAIPEPVAAVPPAMPEVAVVEVEPIVSPSVEPLPSAPTGVLDEAAALIRSGDVVAARATLSKALRTRTLSATEAADVRGTLTVLNNGMIFGAEVTPGDPFTRLYEIKSGDALSRIANREALKTNWRFLQRINGIADPSRIRVGQRIKVVQGPFHAEVDKRAHRIDLWLGEGDEAVFIRSLPVGLGEFGSTPEGAFRVRRGGKMVNPSWTNPRTGERFAAADPNNPIGEYWIGLDGIDPHNLQEQGFGVHGTIDPTSIGEDRSMGCVRLADDDIALVYEMLTEGNSVVLVRE